MLVIFISLLLTMLMSIVIMWGLLVFMTMVGTYMMKKKKSKTISMVYYYTIQELMGFVFLLNLSHNLSMLSLMMKGGFSPFHAWMSKVLEGCSLSFVWLMTMQKMPYYYALSLYLNYKGVLVVYLGVFVALVQGLFSVIFAQVYFFIFTASGNMMLFCGYWDIFLLMTLCPLYLVFSYTFVVGYGLSMKSYEVYCVMMGFPINLNFFVKLLSFYFYLGNGSIFLIFYLVITVLFMLNGLSLFFYSTGLYYNNKISYIYIFVYLYLFLILL